MEGENMVCPKCGARNAPLLTLCGNCGEPLVAPPVTAAAAVDPKVAAWLRQGLLDQKDGEDLGDALLRAARGLDPTWYDWFPAESQRLADAAARLGVSKRDAAQEMLKGAVPAPPGPVAEVTVSTTRQSLGEGPIIELRRGTRIQMTTSRLGELPPDARSEVERALKAQGRVPVEDGPTTEQEETISLRIDPSQNGLTPEQIQSLRDALQRGLSLDRIVLEPGGAPRRRGCLGVLVLLGLPFAALLVSLVARA